MRLTSSLLLACIAAAALRPAPARADSATETRLREALRAATTQLGALEDERAKWQASEAALRGELESLRKQLATAKRAPPPPKPSVCEVAELERRVTEEADVNTKLKESLAQCQTVARDATETARGKEEEQGRLKAEVTALAGRLAASEAKNARMYKVGKEIVERFLNLGVGASLAACEPFLGLKRVELENAAQDYEDKLLEQKVKP